MPQKNILVVEDNPVHSRMIVTVLKSEGYNAETVFTAKDAKETIDRIVKGEKKFDLITLDLILPAEKVGEEGVEVSEKYGYEIGRLLKENEVTKTIPIIGITILGYKEKHKKKLQEIGVDHCIEKPFDVNDLKDTVRLILEKS
ncbi:MAG: response regulator [bacterium]